MLLPHVVRYNSAESEAASTYRHLAESAGAADLPGFLTSLLVSAGLPLRMPERTLTGENIRQLSTEAAAQWTAQFNPVPAGAEDFAALYQAVM
jgi:alcohol dehydrogenase class IV